MTLNHGFCVVVDDGRGPQLAACVPTFETAADYAAELEYGQPEALVLVLTWAEAEERFGCVENLC